MYILLEYKELLSKLQESGFYFHSNVVSYYGWLQCWMTHCKIILYDAVFDWLHCHFRSTYLNLVVLFYKRNRSKAELVNTKQPSDPLLPLAFCSTNPPPLPPAFNSLPSPLSNAVLYGEGRWPLRIVGSVFTVDQPIMKVCSFSCML